MAEGPAEGEWEEDAGMGAAAAERRREKALEREKAKQLEESTPQQKVNTNEYSIYLILKFLFLKIIIILKQWEMVALWC